MSSQAPGPLGGMCWAWQCPAGGVGEKSPVAGSSANSLPLSCQVITRKVNIQVGDVNDNAPTFHNQPYSVRIPEVGVPRIALAREPGWLLQATLVGGTESQLGKRPFRLSPCPPPVQHPLCTG